MSKAQLRMLKEAEDRKMMEAMLAAAVASSSDDDAGDDDDDEGQASMLHVTASASSKKKKKKKKPKKKNAQQSAPSPSVASSSSVENVLVRSEEQTIQKEVKTASAPPPASSKKKKNKSKNKSKKTPEKSGKQMRDENFDNLLREFGGSDTAEAPVVAKATSVKRDSKASSGVLAIDVAKLDYRVDLKNLFGSAVAKSLTKQKRGAGSRTLIARGEADWPTPRATVEFRVLGQQADDGATVYGIEWSTQYAAAEAEFLDCVASNQPNTLVLLLQRYGYHSGALLQLATLSHKSGQFEQAAEMLERSVFFFEHCIGSTFRLDDPLVRIPFSHRENQAMLVTLFKWSSMLGRKGCCGAALECCKMLLSWDRTDPLDILLFVDWLALRSQNQKWLLELIAEKTVGIKKLELYPNLMYGKALALNDLNRGAEAREAMADALLKFPECALSIYTALFGDTAPAAHLQRAVSLYCARAKDLWRSRAVQDLVNSVASTLSFGDSERRELVMKVYECDSGFELPALVKHMMLSEEELETAGQIPAALLQEALNLGDGALNRPPPNDEVAMARLMGSDAQMPSLEEQIESLRRAPTNNALALFLHSLLPWNAPNAPAQEGDETESLIQRAMALLGAGRDGPQRARNQNEENDDDDEEPNRNVADDDSSTGE